MLGVAEGLKITFCDASCVYAAKAQGATLVTEDMALREKAKCAVRALIVGQIQDLWQAKGGGAVAWRTFPYSSTITL